MNSDFALLVDILVTLKIGFNLKIVVKYLRHKERKSCSEIKAWLFLSFGCVLAKPWFDLNFKL